MKDDKNSNVLNVSLYNSMAYLDKDSLDVLFNEKSPIKMKLMMYFQYRLHTKHEDWNCHESIKAISNALGFNYSRVVVGIQELIDEGFIHRTGTKQSYSNKRYWHRGSIKDCSLCSGSLIAPSTKPQCSEKIVSTKEDKPIDMSYSTNQPKNYSIPQPSKDKQYFGFLRQWAHLENIKTTSAKFYDILWNKKIIDSKKEMTKQVFWNIVNEFCLLNGFGKCNEIAEKMLNKDIETLRLYENKDICDGVVEYFNNKFIADYQNINEKDFYLTNVVKYIKENKNEIGQKSFIDKLEEEEIEFFKST